MSENHDVKTSPGFDNMTENDWFALDFEISGLFDGAPIDEEDLFAGRLNEVTRMLRAVMEKSKHIILYGERGVGKTSISNVFWKRYNAMLQTFCVAKVQAGPDDTFQTIWARCLEELKASAHSMNLQDKIPVNDEHEVLTPTIIRRELKKANPNVIPIIIIDEYDKIEDADAKKLTSNLIKELYDYTVTTTLILVGVAENIETLMSDHLSVGRALVQIPLNRMSDSELEEIIQKRIERTRLKFDPTAKWTIVTLSRGLPFFTQTLSKHAAQSAIKNRRLIVSNSDVESAMDLFIKDTESSFRENYKTATRSNKANNFQQSLLACALANTDEEGFFTASDVVSPFSGIMGEPKKHAHFEKHLRRFSSEEGGNILIKRGGDRNQIFRFSDPMMQPYVIIRGIQSDMIDEAARKALLQKEQGELPV